MKFKKFIFKKVISTNLTAINLLKKSQLNYGMITADLQTKGKGQYGRKWISIKGNLFVSFFYNLDKIKFASGANDKNFGNVFSEIQQIKKNFKALSQDNFIR
ncbi:MAG: hypothetical protein EBY59_05420 [Proteobacteria bacterium]|nr:hypothetical protein [Pseudomonadota bacterium]